MIILLTAFILSAINSVFIWTVISEIKRLDRKDNELNQKIWSIMDRRLDDYKNLKQEILRLVGETENE